MTDERHLEDLERRFADALGDALSGVHAISPGTPLPRVLWVQDGEIDQWLAGWRVEKTVDGPWVAGCRDSGAQARARTFLALVEAVRLRKGKTP